MKVMGILLFYYTGKGYWNALIYKNYSIFGLVFRAITFVVSHELLTIGDNLFQLYCLKPAEKVVAEHLRDLLRKTSKAKINKELSQFGWLGKIAKKGMVDVVTSTAVGYLTNLPDCSMKE